MEKFKIVDYHCLEYHHFHCVSEANAWAWAHALSMLTWFNQQIVTFGSFSMYEKGKKWPRMGHFWGLKFGQKFKFRQKIFNSSPLEYHVLETYHFHCMSEANAWAWAHALSMVTWFNQQIVTDLLLFTSNILVNASN